MAPGSSHWLWRHIGRRCVHPKQALGGSAFSGWPAMDDCPIGEAGIAKVALNGRVSNTVRRGGRKQSILRTERVFQLVVVW